MNDPTERYTAERGRNQPDQWYVKDRGAHLGAGEVMAQCGLESDAKLIADALNAQGAKPISK